MNATLRKTLILTALLAPPVASVAFATACSTGQAGARVADRERGRYLVERVGLCADCHTPRNERGELQLDQWLTGSPLPFAPTMPMPFAPVAKPIAGLPTLDDAQAMTFLTTGVLPGGRMPLPPMPPYRFSPDDARDVLAYLRNPGKPTQDPTIAAAAAVATAHGAVVPAHSGTEAGASGKPTTNGNTNTGGSTSGSTSGNASGNGNGNGNASGDGNGSTSGTAGGNAGANGTGTSTGTGNAGR